MSMPFDLGNLGSLMGGLQQSIERLKENARNTQVEGTAGNGLVRVVASGDNQIVSMHISPEAYEDRELLEDLIRAATNEALRKVKKVLAKELSSIAGGLPIPPGLYPGAIGGWVLTRFNWLYSNYVRLPGVGQKTATRLVYWMLRGPTRNGWRTG